MNVGSGVGTRTGATDPVLVWTTRADGDLRPAPEAGPSAADGLARFAAACPHPVSWLRQVHGSDVVIVDAPGAHAGAPADAAVTTHAGAALCVVTADCAPVALWDGRARVLAVAHAGWQGLLAGVIERTVDTMRTFGAAAVRAEIGPCIHPSCYEFGAADLARVTHRLGAAVAGRTSWGTAALDLPEAVAEALTRSGVADIGRSPVCTACSPEHYSHRARRDPQRQALLAWWEP